MKNTAIKILTIIIFLFLIWASFMLEEPPTFNQSLLVSIVLLLGLLIFKE